MTAPPLPRDFVVRLARSCGAKTAFVDGFRRPTWADMHARSDRLAAAMQSLGVRPGETVAILAHDHIEMVEHWYACLKIGAVRAGINWRYGRPEILHLIQDSDARVIIVQHNCLPILGDEGLESARRDGRLIVGFGGPHDLDHDYESLLAGVRDAPSLPPVDPEDVAAISYTTGSTGTPKGALLAHGRIVESLVHTVLGLGLGHDDVWFNPAPMSGAPMLCGAFSMVNGMATVLPGGDFHAERALDLIQAERVTATIFVPTMLRRVVEAQRESPRDLTSLRYVCYGAAPTPPALIRAAKETLGCGLMQMYGATEVWSWNAFLTQADHERGLSSEPGLLASCGRPFVGFDFSIRDANFERVPTGEVGEIWMRGDTCMKGYLHRAEETAEVMRDGWLTLGDLGRFDDRGYLYLVDRRKFLIISGGYNVYPMVVESVIAEHPDVREVTVVGAPHPEWGEAVVAAVCLKPGAPASGEDVIAFCRGRLGRWEVPKFVEIVDELPRGTTGKIQKREVRNWYVAEPERLPWNRAEESP